MSPGKHNSRRSLVPGPALAFGQRRPRRCRYPCPTNGVIWENLRAESSDALLIALITGPRLGCGSSGGRLKSVRPPLLNLSGGVPSDAFRYHGERTKDATTQMGIVYLHDETTAYAYPTAHWRKATGGALFCRTRLGLEGNLHRRGHEHHDWMSGARTRQL